MNDIKELNLYNVRLPFHNEKEWFHIVIGKEGKYQKIEKQSTYICSEKVRLSDMERKESNNSKDIDIEGRLLLPSFVDIHTHLDKAFSLKSVSNRSGTLQEAIQNYSQKVHIFSDLEIKNRVIRAGLQSLLHGTTYIRTHVNFEMDVSPVLALNHLIAVLEAKEKLSPYVTMQVVPMFSNLSTRNGRELEIVEEAVRLGVDGIGGAPHLSPSADKDIEQLFQLAYKYDKFIDLHVDEQDDPSVCTIRKIIEKTEKYDYQNKVVAGHLCSLSAMEEAYAQSIMENMEKQKIAAVTLPGANMYLQGRKDRGIVRRGITRVKKLIKNGVLTATASDNINDPFHPFGKGDLVQIGLLTAYAAHLGGEEDLKCLLQMMTINPAAIFGVDRYGVQLGAPASFTVVDASNLFELFSNLSPTRFVFTNNEWVMVTKANSEFKDKHLTTLWDSSGASFTLERDEMTNVPNRS